MVAQDQEQLLCNICGIKVSAADAKQHVATSSHELRKSTLERELSEVEEKNYQGDISVIARWEKSAVQHTISRSKQSS